MRRLEPPEFVGETGVDVTDVANVKNDGALAVDARQNFPQLVAAAQVKIAVEHYALGSWTTTIDGRHWTIHTSRLNRDLQKPFACLPAERRTGRYALGAATIATGMGVGRLVGRTRWR